MDDRGERCRQRRATDMARRRIDRDQLGVLRLDLPQLANQEVVLGVGDLRTVVGVVPLVVVRDLLPKVRDPGGDLVGLRHAIECKQLRTQ